MMAARREEPRTVTWRDRNRAAAEQRSTDTHPTCPRCLDLLDVGARHCAACGCAVTVEISVEGGDK